MIENSLGVSADDIISGVFQLQQTVAEWLKLDDHPCTLSLHCQESTTEIWMTHDSGAGESGAETRSGLQEAKQQ
jgi:hypothetical protein